MSRLIREKRKPRTNTHLNAKLSPEQNAAADAQSKAARKKIVQGIVGRAQPVTRNGIPIWRGVLP